MSAKKQSGDEAVKSVYRGVDKLLREGKSPKQVESSLVEAGIDLETSSTVVQNAVKMQSRARKSGPGISSWVLVGLFLFLSVAWMINVHKKTDDIKKRFGPVITALEQYRNDMGEYPDSLDKLAPTYLADIPLCPSPSHRQGYTSRRGREYSIICPVSIFPPVSKAYGSSTKDWTSLD